MPGPTKPAKRAATPPPRPPRSLGANAPSRYYTGPYTRTYAEAVTPEAREAARQQLRAIMGSRRDIRVQPTGSTDPRDYVGLAADAFNRVYGAGRQPPVSVRDETGTLAWGRPSRLGQAYLEAEPRSIGLAAGHLIGRGGPDLPAGWEHQAALEGLPFGDVYSALLHEVGHLKDVPHAIETSTVAKPRYTTDDIDHASDLLMRDIDLPRERPQPPARGSR